MAPLYHPFIKNIMEFYELYCATEITDYADSPKKISKNFNKKELTKLNKEFSRINELIEDDMPSIAKILSLDIDDIAKKDLMEKFLIFIQVEKNGVDFFELRDSINDDVERYSKKRGVQNLNSTPVQNPLLDIILKNTSSGLESVLPSKRRKITTETDSLREKVELLNTTPYNKDIIMKKLEKLEDMSRTDSEYHKLKDYISKISRIPFGKFANDKVTPERVVGAKKLLEKHVMFNYEAKDEIINYLVNSSNHCVSLFGPPGTSKSTLVQKGLSEALSRPMKVISLGGKKDSSYLTGHSYTYEGAVCGRIVDILVETQVMNPIIYFDELDKISGKAINGVLTHLIDPSQNFDFHDNYFSGISFDLSKVLFVFSYNEATELDFVVSDRIKHIQVKVLNSIQKAQVLEKITIPNAIEKYFKDTNIKVTFEEDCMLFISQKYEGEGMRGLIKDVDHIISRLKTLYFLRDTEDKKDLISVKYGELELDFDKEIVVTVDMIRTFFEINDTSNESFKHMYM